jgi:hypothetical protein
MKKKSNERELLSNGRTGRLMNWHTTAILTHAIKDSYNLGILQ